MAVTHEGYFLIADITGYTGYLSESELDHAQETLTALLNLLIDRIKPPLVISRLAGDAVISYGLQDHFFQGQTFVEMIEDTYVAFRKAIDRMVLNTTCGCRACKNIRNLDLKFFVHHGSFGLQKLGAHEEMVGTDVNVIHRLLKNSVTEKIGIRAYALYTDAAVRQLGLEAISATMTEHEESYEHVGKVAVWIQDMHPVWEAKRDQAQGRISPDDVLLEVETRIQAAPEVVWDYLIQPEHFNVFVNATKVDFAGTKDGRMTVGSEYQCYHGESYVAMTVLEWQPFERILVQSATPIPIKGTRMLVELSLVEENGTTRFTQSFSKARGPLLGRILMNLGFRFLAKAARRDIEHFGRYVNEDLAGRTDRPEPKSLSAEAVVEAARAGLSNLSPPED